MFDLNVAIRLMNCFPGSFINHNGEFIAHEKANEYFSLSTCGDELDVKCKVLEWLSRAASKGEPFRTDKRNLAFQKFMLDGINGYLHTTFSHDDIDKIYTYLGNACNHKKTIRFIDSGYDMSVLPMKMEA